MEKILRKGLSILVIYAVIIIFAMMLTDRIEKLDKVNSNNNIAIKVFNK